MKIPANLKIFPFHIFLIPLFFVWHILNEYFGLIPINYGIRFLLYYFGLSIVLFLISKLLLKNNLKAGCWTSSFLIIFFFWGAFHDFLKSTPIPPLFHSYKFLFPILLISLLSLFVFIKKMQISNRINVFLVSLFTILVFLELIVSFNNWLSNSKAINNLADKNQGFEIPNIDKERKPDIFFIVFDEYMSSLGLKKYLSFNNSNLDSILVANNFYLADKSKSNYNSTRHSIASTLNINYFPVDLEGKVMNTTSWLKGQYSLKKSRIPVLLSEIGYEIKNYTLFDLENYPGPFKSYFDNEAISLFYKETLWGRIREEIWWNFEQRFAFLRKSKQRIINNQIDQIQQNKHNYQALIRELSFQTATPKFVICHILLPHGPYNVTKNGDRREKFGLDDRTITDSLYINQLVYTNTLIHSIIEKSNHNFLRPYVIVIEGDHGKRDDLNPGIQAVREKQFMNLNSYYFSDRDYSTLYDSISPVNSFRIILNKYFNTKLPILKDSTILLHFRF